MRLHLARSIAVSLAASSLLIATRARAVGEEKSGFPNWEERVLLEWTNRARCDPAVEMTACGTPCAESACYSPIAPVYWSEWAGHSARFHSDEMVKQGYFAHDSKCEVPSTIKSTYPTSCDGSASCACAAASPITTWSSRIGLFGVGAAGEIIATPSDPNSAFYLWLYESSTTTACSFTSANGHRWNILKAGPSLGYGVSGYSTGDFVGDAGDVGKIPSGSHYPRSGPTVDLWANWYDTAPPTSATVNLGGSCAAMTRARGTDTNGAWTYHATGLSGCVRYNFAFKDSTGATVTYPTTGSLGIGDTSCAAYDAASPPTCGCTPSCAGKTCGPDGCGSTCGTCPSGQTCSGAGTCIPSCTPSCGGKACGSDGCGGSCGTCPTGQTCNASGACVSGCTPSCAGKSCGDDGCGGSCGTCPAGQTCNASGACVPSCTPSCAGKTCGSDGCGGTCGSCAAPETCGATGTCVCAAPDMTCGGKCIDVTSDPANCGGCAKVCTAPQVCSKGTCTTSCTSPLVACDRACVDTKTDPLHCGTCTNACKLGETCVAGACVGPKPDAGPEGGTGDAGPISDATLGDSGLGNGASPDDDFTGSCGCRVAGGDGLERGATWGLALAAGGLAVALSRRRRAR